MSNATIYPPANTTAQWFNDNFPGSPMSLKAPVLMLHTTEGFGWPGYQGGATAPNLTFWPGKGWRQHFPINRSSRALVNKAGGVQTNTQGVVQVELVGTCDPSSVVRRLGGVYWPEATDSQLKPLAEFVAWMSREWGLPVESTVKWVAYPKSSANGGGQRLTGKQWEAYSGILGHEHAPENLHGDPGAFPIERLISLAKKELGQTPVRADATPKIVKPFSFTSLVTATYLGKPASHLALVRAWIGSKGTGAWGPLDQAAYFKLTGKRRPDPTTLAPIAAKHGYKLTNTGKTTVAAAQTAALAAYNALKKK